MGVRFIEHTLKGGLVARHVRDQHEAIGDNLRERTAKNANSGILLEQMQHPIENDDIIALSDLVLGDIGDNSHDLKILPARIFKHLPNAGLGDIDAKHTMTVLRYHQGIPALSATEVENVRMLLFVDIEEGGEFRKRSAANVAALSVERFVLVVGGHRDPIMGSNRSFDKRLTMSERRGDGLDTNDSPHRMRFPQLGPRVRTAPAHEVGSVGFVISVRVSILIRREDHAQRVNHKCYAVKSGLWDLSIKDIDRIANLGPLDVDAGELHHRASRPLVDLVR